MRLLALNETGTGNRSLVLLTADEYNAHNGTSPSHTVAVDSLDLRSATVTGPTGTATARLTIIPRTTPPTIYVALVHTKALTLDPKTPDLSMKHHYVDQLTEDTLHLSFKDWWKNFVKNPPDNIMPIVAKPTPAANALLRPYWTKRGTLPQHTHLVNNGIDSTWAITSPKDLATVIEQLPNPRKWLPQPELELLAKDFDAAMADHASVTTCTDHSLSSLVITGDRPAPGACSTCDTKAERLYQSPVGPVCHTCLWTQQLPTTEAYSWSNNTTLPGTLFKDGQPRTFQSFTAYGGVPDFAALYLGGTSPETSADIAQQSHVTTAQVGPTTLTLAGLLDLLVPELMADNLQLTHPTQDTGEETQPLDLTIDLG